MTPTSHPYQVNGHPFKPFHHSAFGAEDQSVAGRRPVAVGGGNPTAVLHGARPEGLPDQRETGRPWHVFLKCKKMVV